MKRIWRNCFTINVYLALGLEAYPFSEMCHVSWRGEHFAEIVISLRNILSMDKLNSTIERYLRSLTLLDVFGRLTGAKERKESSSSDDTILEALGMAEGLAEKVDLNFAELFKLDKLDEIKFRLNNLFSSVSSIEMSMG